MRVTLNLATRPFADLGPAIKRLRIAMGVLAGLAILLGIGLHAIHQKAEAARARDHSLDGQIARVTAERAGYQALMQQPQNAELLVQAAALNKLIDEKAFSWTLAMEDLETVLPAGVQVTSLEPARDEKTRKITVHLKVQGPRDRAVELVRNLEHSRRFLLPRITGENSASETNERPGQPLQPVSASDRVDFDVLADYNPATAEERRQNRKAAARADASEKSTAPRPLHLVPVPLARPTLGRPSYSPQAPRAAQPADRPGFNTPVPISPPLNHGPAIKSNPGVPQ